MLEILEARRLMSATYNADTRTIEIRGTDGDDNIAITRRRDQLSVTFNDGRQNFVASEVQSVTVFGGAGNDRIIGTRAGVPLNVGGEAGNDTITGGAKNDILAGGSGKDTINGNKGDDVLAGDEGNDVLTGGAGNDTLLDTAGDDILLGNAGDDRFEDRDSRGFISGHAGTDSVTLFGNGLQLLSIERITRAPGVGQPAEPTVDLYAQRSDAGIVTVFVQTTYPESGFTTQFGEPTRLFSTVTVDVTGVDTLPAGTPREPVPVVETKPYVLGQLPPGIYNFIVRTGDVVRARLQFGVTSDGLTPGTPTQPGQGGQGTVLDESSFEGTSLFDPPFSSTPFGDPPVESPGLGDAHLVGFGLNGPSVGSSTLPSYLR